MRSKWIIFIFVQLTRTTIGVSSSVEVSASDAGISIHDDEVILPLDRSYRPEDIQNITGTRFGTNHPLETLPQSILRASVLLKPKGQPESKASRGVLVKDPVATRKMDFLLLTAGHVHKKLCQSKYDRIEIVFPGIPSRPAIEESCDSGATVHPTGDSPDLAVWRLSGLSGALHEFLASSPVELGTYDLQHNSRQPGVESGLAFCPEGLRKSGESVVFKATPDFLLTSTENLPGCSGSGLFFNGKLIGIFHGFTKPEKYSQYEAISATVHHSVSTLPSILATKGDAIDGDPSPRSNIIAALPFHADIPGIRAAERILVIPDSQSRNGESLPLSGKTTYDWFHKALTCGVSPEGSWTAKYLLPERILRGDWPVDLAGFTQGKLSVFRRLVHAEELNSHPLISIAREDFPGKPFIFRVQGKGQENPGSGNEIQVRVDERPNGLRIDPWTIRLKPGEILIDDPAISANVLALRDPHFCFRAILLENALNYRAVLYNISVDLMLDSWHGTRTLYFFAQRASAKSIEKLRREELDSLQVLHWVAGDGLPSSTK